MATDKRARKKQARDEALARREAELRRRRAFRVGGLVLLLVVIALLALGVPQALFGGSDKEATPPAGGDENEPQVACGADAPPEAEPKTNYKEPDQVTEEGVDYGAVIHTSCGSIEIDLLEEKTPQTVNNFVFLAQEGYYDGLIWHRVEQNSVLQTGDPNGQNGVPPDGPGYAIPDELPQKAREYVYGVVGMANSGPESGGSQFFIVIHKNRPAGYQPFYSIFGTVTGGEITAAEEDYGCNFSPEQGEPILELLGCQPVQGGNDPVQAVLPKAPIYIESIKITQG